MLYSSKCAALAGYPAKMTGLQVVAIADDLTGALEVGAKFAERGRTAWVTTDLHKVDCRPSPIALTFDTEGRHLSAREAGERVRRLASLCRLHGMRLVYKKTDSTLRGNIGSELNALAETYPELPLFYVPAYPRMGRTVRNGRLYVDGVPVNETEFAKDPLDPVCESNIHRLISRECSGPVISVRVTDLRVGMEPAIYICDGETDDEIREAACFITSQAALWLVAGPAGLAEQLAEYFAVPHGPSRGHPAIRKCLVVNGSFHPVSQAQVEYARLRGWRTADSSEAPRALSESGWVMLETSMGNRPPSAAFTKNLGGTVRRILCQASVDALVIFGGDTAFGVVEALECADLEALAELVPGVPLSRLPAPAPQGPQELYLITKAGGFGPPDVLCKIRALLTE